MMKSPRKRRGARAAAHSPPPTRRPVATSRFDTKSREDPESLRAPRGLTPQWAHRRAARSQVESPHPHQRTDLHDYASVGLQGRSSIRHMLTETHEDLQNTGLYRGTDALADRREYTLLFVFFRPLVLKGSLDITSDKDLDSVLLSSDDPPIRKQIERL